MDISMIIAYLGFFLAAYSVVGNDVIQTLGTFLTSNEKRVPWYVLWFFAASILAATLIYGYVNSDIAYGRLDKINDAIGLATFTYEWYYLIPPLVLLFITRFGIPVSTTFMILTLFSLSKLPSDFSIMVGSVFDTSAVLGGMIKKSMMGYLIAFSSAIAIYFLITKTVEKRFIETPLNNKNRRIWTVLQWLSTGFLWSQWLTQDLANIYVYLNGGFNMTTLEFAASLAILLGLLAYIFYNRGGAVQDIVRAKTNTVDIRSATIIDFLYGIILYIFKYDYFGLWGGKLPMSTTWIFLGLLAGREIAIRVRLENKLTKGVLGDVGRDLLKVFLGLVVSVLLVFLIKWLSA
jgi:hypothetical protein